MKQQNIQSSFILSQDSESSQSFSDEYFFYWLYYHNATEREDSERKKATNLSYRTTFEKLGKLEPNVRINLTGYWINNW